MLQVKQLMADDKLLLIHNLGLCFDPEDREQQTAT